MDISELFHTKTEVYQIIYTTYLAGFAVEDISFITFHGYEWTFSFDDINDIIDYMNYLNN